MGITIKIELYDDGQIAVGVDKGDADEAGAGGMGDMGAMMGKGGGQMMSEGQEDANMQKVGSVDEALAVAKQLLTAGAQQGPAAAPGGGMMMGSMSSEDQAWNKVKADRKALA